MTNPTRIAIAGLGRMGQPIALRLLAAGADLVLLAPRHTRLPDELAQVSQADAARLTHDVDVVITCLRDSSEVSALLPGLLAAASRPILHIDHTSGDPVETRRHAELWLKAGHSHVDAALSGTPDHAIQGQLKILAGGSASDIARLETIALPYAGGGVIHAGDHGQGHLLRLVAGMMGFGIAALSAEMLTLADSLNLDRHLVHRMITGSGADSRTFQAVQAIARDGAASGKTRQLPILAASRDLSVLDAMVPQTAPSRLMLKATLDLLQRADPDSDPARMISSLHGCLSNARRPE